MTACVVVLSLIVLPFGMVYFAYQFGYRLGYLHAKEEEKR